MSVYDLRRATLQDVEGEGYCYARKTVFGKEYQGVFFGDDIADLADEEAVTFEGVVYDRSRGKKLTLSVEVTNVTSTPSGERADFVALEKP